MHLLHFGERTEESPHHRLLHQTGPVSQRQQLPVPDTCYMLTLFYLSEEPYKIFIRNKLGVVG